MQALGVTKLHSYREQIVLLGIARYKIIFIGIIGLACAGIRDSRPYSLAVIGFIIHNYIYGICLAHYRLDTLIYIRGLGVDIYEHSSLQIRIFLQCRLRHHIGDMYPAVGCSIILYLQIVRSGSNKRSDNISFGISRA